VNKKKKGLRGKRKKGAYTSLSKQEGKKHRTRRMKGKNSPRNEAGGGPTIVFIKRRREWEKTSVPAEIENKENQEAREKKTTIPT